MLEYFEYRNTIKWSGNKDNFPLTLMLAISSPTIYSKHIILEANFVRASKRALVRNIERENLFSTQSLINLWQISVSYLSWNYNSDVRELTQGLALMN